MANGIIAELNELIDLKRFAQSVHYHPQRKGIHLGNHLSKVRGRGMDFSEVRNYQAGDEIRHMEWRVTARTGRPHIKLYQEERERPVVMLADFNPSMIFGTRIAFKSVIAARLAALLAWTVIKQGDKIGGLFFSATEHSEFVPRGRESAVLPLLGALSHYTKQTHVQCEAQPKLFRDALIRLRRVVKPGSTLVLISDFYSMDAECEKHLSRLRRHNDVLAYHICDPIELTPPKPQEYAITNGSQELLLDTRMHSVNKAYEHYFQKKITELQEQLKRLQIQYLQVTSETDLTQLIQRTLPRRSHD
jgi:uncharacterized protein (DUF58 family)